MNQAQSIRAEDLQDFRKRFSQDPMSHVATRAVSKCSIHDICYDAERAKNISHQFSLDLQTMNAANQKNSGRCWIFAGMNLLREKIARELNLEEFELSQNYISFYDHLEKANSFLERIIETASEPLEDRYISKILTYPVGDGGWWEYFVGLCRKYGVVPKESMPETRQSTDTEPMNALLNMQLRRDAVQLRRAHQSGKSDDEIQALKKEMLCRVYRLLAICLGTPPQIFDFEYVDKDHAYHADRDLTPLEFYNRYLGRDLSQIVSIMNAPIPEAPFHHTYVVSREESIHNAFHSKRLNLPMAEFKAAVLRQLQDGDPVWFVCDCDYYFSMEEGIWDPELYDYETLFGLDLAMEKGDLLEYRQCTLNHAMLLTGVNLVDGRPDKWKIQNSWGTEKGNQGYFVMSDAWFDRYVFTASIDQKYLTDAQRVQFSEEPVDLPLWSVLA